MGRSQRHLREIQGKDSRNDTTGGTNDPQQVTVPTVTGTNTVGQTLTGANGTFRGQSLSAITRAWTRNGVAISGATGGTYVLQVADTGTTVRFTNTVTNPFGSATSVSAGRTISA